MDRCLVGDPHGRCILQWNPATGVDRLRLGEHEGMLTTRRELRWQPHDGRGFRTGLVLNPELELPAGLNPRGKADIQRLAAQRQLDSAICRPRLFICTIRRAKETCILTG